MKTIEKISVDCGNPDEKNDQKTGNISDNDQRICDISNIEIDGITLDSRKVKEGFMFVCIKGLETDGHRYIDKAVEAGAAAIVYCEPLGNFACTSQERKVCYIKVEDTVGELAAAANVFYDDPSSHLKMFAVTGTNGKTTTSSIISGVFSHCKPCGYMGTIAVKYGNTTKKTSLTTPDPVEIQSNLAEMRDNGMKAAAMEVSSHGLAMRRTRAIDFDCAIFTNLTYDHLDYHKTMENYFEAKKILFKELKSSAVAVLNRDDEKTFDALVACTGAKCVSYGIDNEADYSAIDLVLKKDGSEFTLRHAGKEYRIKTNLIAKYNIYNLLAAVAAMKECGMDIEEMIPYLNKIPQVAGRMDVVNLGQAYRVIVDYAHTPDGFEKIFEYAREVVEPDSNIYAVFGSAGKRDRKKRSVLGEIAGKSANLVLVTEEDPRNESADGIAEEIIRGVKKSGGKAVKILDRRTAINYAVDMAKPGDMILILGKGTEDYMAYEDGKRAWDGDLKVASDRVKMRMSAK